MPRKLDPEEYKRFLETAKAVEASDAPEDFERAFKKVAKPSTPSAASKGSQKKTARGR
jgi:hypothetical protein